LRLITLYLPESYIKNLDQLVAEQFYPNRSEAIRCSVKDLLKNELWKRRVLR
jgi:Arc/MetJ-type ribon-helix-helix transcriptional regulator